MTQRKTLAMVVVLLLAATTAMAQAPGKAPTPGPENKRLGAFVGKWSGTADTKASPMGPAGKMSWTETCEWFNGNFAVVCRTDGTGPMGPSKGLGILSYSTEDKTYIYNGIESTNGEFQTAKGTVQGKVWTWLGDGKMAGKPFKVRYTSTEVSNDSQSFKFEMSQDAGKTWTLVQEGKSTRAK